MSEDEWTVPPKAPRELRDGPPDEFGQKLLDADAVDFDSLDKLRRYLASRDHTILGTKAASRHTSWTAEVRQTPVPVILLTNEVLTKAYAQANDTETGQTLQRLISEWNEAGWLVEPPERHQLSDVRVALRLEVLVHGFKPVA